MRKRETAVIAKREFLARVKTKGFWISTLALPLIMAAMMVVPSIILMKTRTSHRLLIVDATGEVGKAVAAHLAGAAGPASGAEGTAAGAAGTAAGVGQRQREMRASSFEVTVEPAAADAAAQRRELDARILRQEVDGWIWIDDRSLDQSRVEYHGESVSNFLTQELLEDSLEDVFRETRLRRAGYDVAEIGKLTRDVDLATVRVSEEGTREERGLGGFMFAYFLFFMLFMMILIYGQQVMNGVLEEKGSRVVEVVVSTVQPFELLMGKLVGICLVALVQLGLWLGTTAVVTAPGALAALSLVPEEAALPSMTPALALNFFLFFLLGFFLYASLYAALGSAFNSLQEAQQVASVLSFVFVMPFMFMFTIINDPDSTLAVVLSLIPPFTPFLMMLRVAVKMPPLWQLLLSYFLTAAFTVAMVWVGAKIYRVGILMYGKKPTLPELLRWVRYA
jgi:ABC-2 type transport system permease protein